MRNKVTTPIVRTCKHCERQYVRARSDDGAGFCSGACFLRSQKNPSRIDRFFQHVEKTDRCWWWTGKKLDTGYGVTDIDDPNREIHATTAQRVAWMLATGTAPEIGEHVAHTCDHPSCVRNDDVGTYEVDGVSYPRRGHLYLCPHSANMRDAVEKRRMQHGSSRPMAKLTEADVACAREQRAKGVKNKDLARHYGVSKQTMSKAIRREKWKHVL